MKSRSKSDVSLCRFTLRTYFIYFKAAVLQNILKLISYKLFKISLQIYITVVKNKKTYLFSLFCMKTGHSLFCHRDIPTIHNGYCVSTAVDYTKKTELGQ